MLELGKRKVEEKASTMLIQHGSSRKRKRRHTGLTIMTTCIEQRNTHKKSHCNVQLIPPQKRFYICNASAPYTVLSHRAILARSISPKPKYALFCQIMIYGAFFLPKTKIEAMRSKKCGTLHDFACHPCAGAMLIFSVSFQF